MIRCEPIINALSEIVDGEASFGARVRFYGHMLMCSHCRAYFRQFRELKELVREQPPLALTQLPDDFFEVMERTVQAQLQQQRLHSSEGT